jgi:hypothetical protein
MGPDIVGSGKMDVRALDYMQPNEPKGRPKIRRMKVKSRQPGSNVMRKMHAKGLRMAVPK